MPLPGYPAFIRGQQIGGVVAVPGRPPLPPSSQETALEREIPGLDIAAVQKTGKWAAADDGGRWYRSGSGRKIRAPRSRLGIPVSNDPNGTKLLGPVKFYDHSTSGNGSRNTRNIGSGS